VSMGYCFKACNPRQRRRFRLLTISIGQTGGPVCGTGIPQAASCRFTSGSSVPTHLNEWLEVANPHAISGKVRRPECSAMQNMCWKAQELHVFEGWTDGRKRYMARRDLR
jgi:hypothetical protein